MTHQAPENSAPASLPENDWIAVPSAAFRSPSAPPLKSLFFACGLFLLTLCTCLAAGTQFAIAYSHDKAVDADEFVRAFQLFYKHPTALLAGLPFAITLLTILLAHELGHFFACRHHHIRATYPFFIPFPSLIGTFGAFILLRSPIRTTRSLFDVGASGPLAGFVFAFPALLFGLANARIIPAITDTSHADIVFGTPLLLRLLASLFHPGVAPGTLLLHPIGRAAWVGLFATSLNLLPSGQLDGGHILRALSAPLHRWITLFLPLALLPLGYFFWYGWFFWAALLFGLRFFRVAPIYDPTPLDPNRRFLAFVCLIVFLLSFMPAPFLGL